MHSFFFGLTFGLTVWSFVHWYEEPTLSRRLDPEYDEYLATVPGWWPRRPRPRGIPWPLAGEGNPC